MYVLIHLLIYYQNFVFIKKKNVLLKKKMFY